MVENEKNIMPNLTTDKSLSDADTPALPQAISKGERVYNWGVYSGMNYWLNLAMSVVITDIFVNRSGKRFVNKCADFIAKRFPNSYDGTHHHAKTAINTFMLLSGGNILLIPLKIMEDRKRPIVHWLNKKFGVDQTAPDGHEMTPDEIYIEQEQPKQSWTRVVIRRAMGWAAVVGSGQIINGAFRDRSKPYPLPHEDDVFGGKNVVTNKVMGFLNKNVFKSGFVPGGKWLAANKTAQAYMGFTVLDAVFTKITAIIMHVTNGAHKSKRQKQKEAEAAAAAAAEEEAKSTIVAMVPPIEQGMHGLGGTGSDPAKRAGYLKTITEAQKPTSYTEKAALEPQQPEQVQI